MKKEKKPKRMPSQIFASESEFAELKTMLLDAKKDQVLVLKTFVKAAKSNMATYYNIIGKSKRVLKTTYLAYKNAIKKTKNAL